MTDVFKLMQRRDAWAYRLVWVFALQCLDPGHFVRGIHLRTTFGKFCCLQIDATDRFNFF